MLTDEQMDNLRHNAKGLTNAKNEINEQFNGFVKMCQKLGYSVNPKTGELKELSRIIRL